MKKITAPSLPGKAKNGDLIYPDQDYNTLKKDNLYLVIDAENNDVLEFPSTSINPEDLSELKKNLSTKINNNAKQINLEIKELQNKNTNTIKGKIYNMSRSQREPGIPIIGPLFDQTGMAIETENKGLLNSVSGVSKIQGQLSLLNQIERVNNIRYQVVIDIEDLIQKKGPGLTKHKILTLGYPSSGTNQIIAALDFNLILNRVSSSTEYSIEVIDRSGQNSGVLNAQNPLVQSVTQGSASYSNSSPRKYLQVRIYWDSKANGVRLSVHHTNQTNESEGFVSFDQILRDVVNPDSTNPQKGKEVHLDYLISTAQVFHEPAIEGTMPTEDYNIQIVNEFTSDYLFRHRFDLSYNHEKYVNLFDTSPTMRILCPEYHKNNAYEIMNDLYEDGFYMGDIVVLNSDLTEYQKIRDTRPEQKLQPTVMINSDTYTFSSSVRNVNSVLFIYTNLQNKEFEIPSSQVDSLSTNESLTFSMIRANGQGEVTFKYNDEVIEDCFGKTKIIEGGMIGIVLTKTKGIFIQGSLE